jgi:hypothetical protein
MFNLEEAIADWRQKMLAAGIETPVPLEELELHLREEIERQIGKGISAEEALAGAAKKMGAAHPLKIEFQKAGSISPFGFQRIYDLLLVVYAAYTAAVTLGMILGAQLDRSLFAGGSVAAFWMGLSGNGLVRTIISVKNVAAAQSLQARILAAWQNTQPANHLPTAVILLNLICFTAVLATLWVRGHRPLNRLRVTRLLNWTLLPALPFGTVIAVYGFWCAKQETDSEEDKTWLGQAFVLKLKSLPDHQAGLTLKLLAGIGRSIFALALGLAGSSLILIGWIEVLRVILMPSTPPELHLGFRLLHPFILIIALLSLFVGTWLLCWTLQILQSLREFSIGEAQSLLSDSQTTPAETRNKFIQISLGIICVWLGSQLIAKAPWRAIAAGTHFSRAYSDGSFSFENLMIGPVFDLYNGIMGLLGIAGFFWSAWINFRKYLNPFRQKAQKPAP